MCNIPNCYNVYLYLAYIVHISASHISIFVLSSICDHVNWYRHNTLNYWSLKECFHCLLQQKRRPSCLIRLCHAIVSYVVMIVHITKTCWFCYIIYKKTLGQQCKYQPRDIWSFSSCSSTYLGIIIVASTLNAKNAVPLLVRMLYLQTCCACYVWFSPIQKLNCSSALPPIKTLRSWDSTALQYWPASSAARSVS